MHIEEENNLLIFLSLLLLLSVLVTHWQKKQIQTSAKKRKKKKGGKVDKSAKRNKTRELYIGGATLLISDPLIGFDVYIREHDSGSVDVLGFTAQRGKPELYIGVNNMEQATLAVATFVAAKKKAHVYGAAANEAAKIQQQATQMHDIKLDDVLFCCYNNNQICVEFYQVIKLVGRRIVKIRPIESIAIHDSDKRMPKVGHFCGGITTHRVRNNAINIENNRRAYICERTDNGEYKAVSISENY